MWGTSGGEESTMAKRKRQKESSLEQQQPYDNALKSLLEGQEAQILPHFLPEAIYLETYNIEAVRTILRTDRIYKVLYKGQPHILHLEFETSSDDEMAVRLLDYHAYLYHKYHLPVISIIVYPFRTTVATSPLQEISAGEIILSFKFRIFPLWLLDANQYTHNHIIAMYALLPAMSGANAHLLDQAIDEMVEYYKDDEITLARDLRWMGIILRRTDCVLKEDKRMIQERLSMYDDLMENDPEMKRLREKYKSEGLAEGLAEGEIKALRKTILTVVKTRFPSLVKQAQQRVAHIADVDDLTALFEQIMTASDEASARAFLVIDHLT
jgi:hypothetical protein